MTRPDNAYFDWLVSQIDIPKGKSYDGLLGRLHLWEFAWLVPGDNNRYQDALDLRSEYLSINPSSYIIYKLVSVLEVTIALSRRVAFIAENTQEYWAWCLIKNVGLARKSDPLTSTQIQTIDQILHNLVWRQYNHDGTGGFFPLKETIQDQTKVEIWYQMNAYVNEMPN